MYNTKCIVFTTASTFYGDHNKTVTDTYTCAVDHVGELCRREMSHITPRLIIEAHTLATYQLPHHLSAKDKHLPVIIDTDVSSNIDDSHTFAIVYVAQNSNLAIDSNLH